MTRSPENLLLSLMIMLRQVSVSYLRVLQLFFVCGDKSGMVMMSGILLPWMVNGRSGFRQIYPLLLIAHPIAVVCSQLHSNLVYCDMYRPPPKLTNLICGALLQGKKVYATLYPIQFPKRRPDIDKMRYSPVPPDPTALFALPLIISSDIGPTICSTRLRRTSTLLEILSHLQVASLEGKK